MKEKCTYANRYEGKVRPTCGCKACDKKYKDEQHKREAEQSEEALLVASICSIIV